MDNEIILERVMRMGVEYRALGNPDLSVLFGLAKAQLIKEEKNRQNINNDGTLKQWIASPDLRKMALILKQDGEKKEMHVCFVRDDIDSLLKHFVRMSGNLPVFDTTG